MVIIKGSVSQMSVFFSSHRRVSGRPLWKSRGPPEDFYWTVVRTVYLYNVILSKVGSMS